MYVTGITWCGAYIRAVNFNSCLQDVWLIRLPEMLADKIPISVIEPGSVAGGSEVEILSRDPHRVTVVDIVRLYLDQTRDPELLQRAMNVSALPRNWKAELTLRARTDRA